MSKELKDLKRQIEDKTKTPEFNNGECGKTCNCIEIAEAKNSGDLVKDYPCLGFGSSSFTEPIKL